MMDGWVPCKRIRKMFVLRLLDPHRFSILPILRKQVNQTTYRDATKTVFPQKGGKRSFAVRAKQQLSFTKDGPSSYSPKN